jgi:serine protease Do
LNLKGTAGVLVSNVEPGGLAAEAGIRRGDVILEVNRSSVKDVKSMTEILERDKDRKSVLFLINRGGRTIFVALSK